MSIGDVFIKTHTKSDGTYVDRKAEKIALIYEKNLQDKLVELESDISDGTSRPRQLTQEDYTAIFLQVSFQYHMFFLWVSSSTFLTFLVISLCVTRFAVH